MTKTKETITSKNAKIFLFAGFIAAMVLPFSGMNFATADIEYSMDSQLSEETKKLREKASKMDSGSTEFFQLIKRDPLSSTELSEAKDIMKKNINLKNQIDANSLDIIAITFSGNANTLPVKWYPVIHTSNGTENMSIKLDLEDEEIEEIEIYEPEVLGLTNAYAVDEYVGTHSFVKGIKVTAENQPNYNGNSTYTGFSALVLNAKMYGSVRDNMCKSAYFPSNYWMQMGIKFNERVWKYVVADTTTNCWSFELSLPEPNATDNVTMKINSGSTWWGVLHNEDTNDFVYYSKSGMNSGWIHKGDESTGVFFENGYTTTGWDSQFNGTKISLTDAQVQKSNGSWVDWSSNSQYVLDCKSRERTDNVISGSLKSGKTATWDISAMTGWPKC